jgi:hypothetical protein
MLRLLIDTAHVRAAAASVYGLLLALYLFSTYSRFSSVIETISLKFGHSGVVELLCSSE